MTIYEKPRSEVFASNAPDSEISTFTAWLRGLGIAFDETNGLPEMSGLNNVFNLLNQYIKYLEQNGFAEWSSDLEYPIGAGVRVGAVWYRAKNNPNNPTNINKPPATSQNDWELFLNASALTYENPIYIENNIVKVRGATQSQSGVVQFANDTEIANKTNTGKVINPANSLSIASSVALGVGQSWVNLTNQRQSGVTYTNNTGKPIAVKISTKYTSSSNTLFLYINGIEVQQIQQDADGSVNAWSDLIVPSASTYRIVSSNGFSNWSELR